MGPRHRYDAQSITVSVRPVNDAPSSADAQVSTPEDNAYVFQPTDFPFADGNDSPANNLLAVRIATPPTAGTLALNGIVLGIGASVQLSDITAGLFTFTPAANANGSPYARFTFQVQDDGGTDFGGKDLDPVAHTMTVNVTPVNDPPTGADNSTLVTLEDTSRGFVASDFGFSDGTDNNANGLGTVIILTAPSSGTLQLGGTDQTTFPLTVIAGNLAQLTFKPAADANDGNIAKPFFTFKVQDNGGTASGGVDTSRRPTR